MDADGLILYISLEGKHALPAHYQQNVKIDVLLTDIVRQWYMVGRAVAQAVSRWLPTTATWVCVQAACGVCGRQSGTGAGFLRVHWFPLPIFPPISPSS
jgi:hypothetical protein